MKVLATLILFLSTTLFAHDGHDHGPSNVQPPKGGVMKSLEEVHIEVLYTKKNPVVKIYVYAMDLKAADLSKYPIKASVTMRKQKAQNIVLENKGDHWEYTFDAKNAHRYNLDLNIKQGNHDDKLSFTIEPK